jgi:hypothetical protein
MNRIFIDSLNRHSPVEQFEVSPCLDFNYTGDDPHTEAFETFAEAEAQSDEALGPIFYGVYACTREVCGLPPAMHLDDFPTFDEAMRFVYLLNGVPQITYMKTEGDS